MGHSYNKFNAEVGLIDAMCGRSNRSFSSSSSSCCKQTDPYEKTKNEVYATGNQWAIENFNATHN